MANETAKSAGTSFGHRPHFSVRARGMQDFVGAGWMQENAYGKYIAVRLTHALEKGSVIYLHPRKDAAGIL